MLGGGPPGDGIRMRPRTFRCVIDGDLLATIRRLSRRLSLALCRPAPARGPLSLPRHNSDGNSNENAPKAARCLPGRALYTLRFNDCSIARQWWIAQRGCAPRPAPPRLCEQPLCRPASLPPSIHFIHSALVGVK